jgi:hypothetical protein
MLPFLPALLLLILRGPSAYERPQIQSCGAQGGEAVYRHVGCRKSLGIFAARHEVFTSVVAQFLGLTHYAAFSESSIQPPVAILSRAIARIASAPVPCDRFLESERSRDGPFAV